MIYVFGRYTLDTQRHEVQHVGVPIKLERKAYQVLVYLVEHRDRLVTKDELLEQIWPEMYVNDSAISGCIGAIRRAIGDQRNTQRVIQTLHGQGYRFVAEVTIASAAAETPGTADAPALQTCKTCAHPNPAVAQVCMACGQSLNMVCPQCGQDISIPATYCSACGQQLTPAPPAPLSASPVNISEPSTASGLPASPMPAIAREPMSGTTLETTGERKLVTVLCGTMTFQLTQSNDLDDLQVFLQAVGSLVRNAIQPYDGVLYTLTTTEITVVFGAWAAQEDHAHRAARAAWAIQQQWPSLLSTPGRPPGRQGPISLGLDTGHVALGPETGARLETLVGPTLNQAGVLARLALPGTIMISEETARLLPAWMPLEALSLGPQEEVSTRINDYRLSFNVEIPAVPMARRSRFVGRTEELAALHHRLMQVQEGQGQIVGIVGEPGIGKSRLVEEFCQTSISDAVTLLLGHCQSYGQDTPYLPLRQIFRQLLGLTATDGVAERQTKIQAYLQQADMAPELWSWTLAPVFGEVSELPEEVTGLSLAARRARTFTALLQLVMHHSQRQPLILVVEDLHWIDATSQDYLTALVERLPAMAVSLLLTYRPGYQPPWGSSSRALQLALAPLSMVDSHRLVQSVLPQHQQRADTYERLTQQAQGNPFFLEELAQAMREQSAREPVSALPVTIETVLAARLARLPAAAKQVVQIAAVVGTTISLSLLQALTPLPEVDLDEQLRHLQQAEFVYESRLVPEPIYQFKHALTREVAYQLLLRQTRQQLIRTGS